MAIFTSEFLAVALAGLKYAAAVCALLLFIISGYRPAGAIVGLACGVTGWGAALPGIAVFVLWSLWRENKGLPLFPLYILAGGFIGLFSSPMLVLPSLACARDEAEAVMIIFGFPCLFFLLGAVTAGGHWEKVKLRHLPADGGLSQSRDRHD